MANLTLEKLQIGSGEAYDIVDAGAVHKSTDVGVAGGVASLDATTGKVPMSQLDSTGLVQGNNIQLTLDTTSNQLTISATDTTYSDATTSTAGLMSVSDKNKLDGVAPGATANTGTVTSISVSMNGASKGTVTTSGTIDLGTVITDISSKEDTANKTTSLTASSTDTQYPSAKLVYDQLATKSTVSVATTGTSTSEAKYITVNGVEWKLAAGGSSAKLGSITTSTTWEGTGPFTQTVTVTGATVTENSKVDLQPDAATLTQMADDGCSMLYIVNDFGTLTLTAIGGFLSVAKTIQVTVTETITEA